MASDTNTSTPSTPNPPPPEITIMSPSSPPPTSSSPSSPHGINGTAHGPVAAAVSGTTTPSRTPRSGTPITTHLTLGGKNHKILDKTGYTDIRFPGKEEQFRLVVIALKSKGFIPNDLVEMEAKWFYNNLGIDDAYYAQESIDTIVNHILSLYGAKVAAFARNDTNFEIRLDREERDHAVYIDTSEPGVSNVTGPQYEHRIDERYLNGSTPARAYRIETFRSMGSVSATSKKQIRAYFVSKCNFVNPNPSLEEMRDIRVCSDKTFLEKVTENTLDIYQSVVDAVLQRSGPVIEMFEIEGSREHRLVIGYRQLTAKSFFSSLSDLYHFYGLTSSRKYVEQFSNGVTVISVYLLPARNSVKFPPIESSIYQIIKEASLLYCMPRSQFQPHFAVMELSIQECVYAHCAWVFVGHFLNRLGSEYQSLQSLLDPENSAHQEILSKLKKRLRDETFTRQLIFEIMSTYPSLLKLLYLNFAWTHYIPTSTSAPQDIGPTLSFQRLQTETRASEKDIYNEIQRQCQSADHVLVMSSIMVFNQSVLKTNFYQPTKVAVAFRLNPGFLSKWEYPISLFGMFLVIGSEFRGFHLRFREVARGGIRIVKSRSKEAYALNARTLFDENYNLASTQQRKNKDIPEGGAKGVILLDYDQQDQPTIAFEKYIDSILDLLLPGHSPGIKDQIVDLHGQEEILFMGPDENTAHLVDWATEHARIRGARWWKSFFTGKSMSLGGIPHDKFGMTTVSVRAFVEGIYNKFGLKQEDVTKMQTGGPDGDLGSNEILQGREKYTTIIDGSGVIADPHGLDREELVRLAHAREMISGFDTSKLSKEGFRVLIEETDVKLPSGEVVPNGMTFRNTYHLRGQAQCFLPCGGRPEAVDISNVHQLIVDGKSKFAYIIEGANLFLTQEAKLRLEKAGAIVYKDASANKGGVTSSSLEVLASLSFDDAGYLEHMCVKDDVIPDFYKRYVKNVQRIIESNARLEFEAIWREHKRTKKPRSLLSDEISNEIIKLDEELQKTALWDNISLRKNIMQEALPETLREQIGLDTMLERVPVPYLKAIFGSYLASRFIYLYGIGSSQFAFFDFMNQKLKLV